MSTVSPAQVLGASTIGGTGLALLGVPLETSIAIGLTILFTLLCFYLVYKFRNRNIQ